MPPRTEKRAGRTFLWLSFALVVWAPVGAAAIYYFGFAADQYVSEVRFTLRTAEPAPIAPNWLIGPTTGQSQAAIESRVLVQYVLSRAIVDDIGHGLDLRRLYASPSADWWARLRLPVSIEGAGRLLAKAVDAYYEPADATVVIEVRAFAPADSLQVARAVVAACQRLVNQLSLQMRQDALQQAAHEVADTQARLASTMADIRDFREREGLINPNQTAQASTQLAARLDEDLVQSRAKLSTLRTYMSDGSPAVSVLKARIRALEAQRRTLVHPTTGPIPRRARRWRAPSGLSRRSKTRNKFAEDAYSHALAGLDRAHAEADRQQVYIASFVPPTLAEEPLYPRRWRMLGVAALIAFAVWAIGGLSVQSIRDHI